MRRILMSLCVVFLLVQPICSEEPQGAADYFRRAVERCSRGEYDLSIQDFDEVIKLQPKLALAYSSRGAVWFTKKDYDKAIRDVSEAVRLEPGEASSGYYIRGAAYYMKHDYARAAKDLDEAIRLNSDEAEALNSRAWMAATCSEEKYRDSTIAHRYAKRACELDGWKNPFYLGTFAAACAAKGDFKEAVKWQKKALEDPALQKAYGEQGRLMLKLFEVGKPYYEVAESKKKN